MTKALTPTNKKQRIIQAASSVFCRKGFAAARMVEVAVEAGIGKGTIYEYFTSKEDLFFAVFQWFSIRTSDTVKVDILALQGSAAKRLRVMNDSVMRMWAAEMDNFALMMEFWSASASSNLRRRFKEAFKSLYARFTALVSGLIREGIAAGEFRADADPDAVAAALVGTWDALLLQKWFESVADPQAYSRAFLKIILDGLRKTPEQDQ